MVKIGRNDPCPCGSGKKYKKCCYNFVTVQTEEEYKSLEERYNAKKVTSKNQLKMSKVIIDFAEDLIAGAEDELEHGFAIEVAVLCWNIAVDIPEHLQDKAIMREIKNLEIPMEVRNSVFYVMRDLVKRKKEEYSHIRRHIEDFEITFSENEAPKLDVISMPSELSLGIKAKEAVKFLEKMKKINEKKIKELIKVSA